VAVDYTEEVVVPLGAGIEAVTGGGTYAPASMAWDCSIGGLNFLYATSATYPMRRETSKFRKERIDTERNPGEQSLDSGLWIRSQASWHYGAGLSSAEPLEVASAEAAFRYYKSGGVNPWTPGQLTLLNKTEQVLADAITTQHTIGVGTGVLHASDTALKHVANNDTATTITWGGSGVINAITSTGQYWLACDTVGIYKGELPTGAGAKIYDKDNTVTSSVARWVKSRLMYAENNNLYEITDLAPGSPSLPSVHYEHKDPDWVWTDFVEGPTAIYVSGHSGELSAVYRITVTVTDATVTLSQPAVIAEMPRSEQVLSMYSYLGSFLIFGTTAGCRIASIQSDGTIVMGPLLWDGTIVDDAVALGSYVYVTVRDKGEAGDNVQRAGLYRINLGQTIGDASLAFAYAPDLAVPSGTTGGATNVTVSNDLLWFSVTGSGVYRQMSDYLVDGWVQTGRIRLGTMEKKAWRDLRIIGQIGMDGTIEGYASVSGLNAPSTWDKIITVDTSNPDLQGKLNTAAPNPAPDLHLAFRLTSNLACTCPTPMIGYQVRALPSPRRNELIQIPVMMFDWETDKTGVKFGQPGGAWLRYQSLKDMEITGATILYKDHTTGESVEVYVEETAYIRNTPPSNGLNRSGNGGVATVLLRTV